MTTKELRTLSKDKLILKVKQLQNASVSVKTLNETLSKCQAQLTQMTFNNEQNILEARGWEAKFEDSKFKQSFLEKELNEAKFNNKMLVDEARGLEARAEVLQETILKIIKGDK